MNRRTFTILSAGTAASLAGLGKSVAGGEGFFTLRVDRGQWWLCSPEGQRFFSLGLPLRSSAEVSEEERAHWQTHYGRDAQEWAQGGKEGEDSLLRGRFNTWSTEGNGSAPYCHVVPFSGAEIWNRRERQVNYLRPEWEEWCDHIAREHCLPRRDDRKLIGYFYSKSPCWLDEDPLAEWRGPLYDPAMLVSTAGRLALRQLARRYYQTTRDAIRRYDPNHLILGDRFEGSSPLPREVHEEARERVDLFAFQDFRRPAASLRTWHQLTGKAVLLADTAPASAVDDDQLGYGSLIRELLANPGCVGCHLLPAQGGSQDEKKRFAAWRQANEAAERWVAREAGVSRSR